MINGKTIITYLVSGDATGIKTVEFSNRLIKGVYIPRKDFKSYKERLELNNSGIYFLLGEDEEGNGLAYLGQATVLGKRLNDHFRDIDKDFWNVAIAFTYKDGTLNESDINFLERELIKEAKNTGRYKIKNGNGGNNGLIQEHRIPDMVEFIHDLKILLGSLGFKLFKELVTKEDLSNKENIFYLTSRGSNAKGLYNDEGFLVLKGSTGVEDIIPYQLKAGHIARNRQKFLEKGVITKTENGFIFEKDYLFKTPTSGCNIISGGNLNGWIEWKNKNGNTLDEIIRKNNI